MNWVLILGLLLNLALLPLAARRVVWLYRLITSGQPDPGRVEGVTSRVGQAAKTQLVEVFAQQKLLKWTVPGAAHLFVFWAFLILATVYLEAYGVLLGPDDFAIPLIGRWELLGFAQDMIAVLALVSLGVFAQIRLKNAPEKLGRRSRFSGSHLGGAWMVLFMIFNVIWTMFLFRGASSALGNLPYDGGAFVSVGVGNLLDGLSEDALHVVEGIGLLLHIGVMLVFLVIVLNSKHLHIFVAPLNVMFKRQPVALGAARPLMSAGKPVSLDDLEEMDEDTKLGIGSVEDFSWKGLLDFATCTECGRCQDQCPAWNTEKPLSPKMLIMNMRDHAFHIGSYLQADQATREKLLEDDPELAAEVDRALVGATEGDAWNPSGGAVIDPDVLWSCVTCGACVQQCPVDIEHVDHIIDMRRHQVLVENNFPAELNQLFKGLESKGNPWNLSPNMRMDWAQGLDFDVPVVGEDLESLDSVDWLFWVGCAGAYEDRAKKTTRAVAELLDMAGISFGVLGKGETCTGDSARRAGNEFVFQGLAQQNVETFKEFKVKKVVSTCAHCFNTLKNEYQEFGIELEVVHHTQLLNRLVREGKLTPVNDGAGAAKRSITYHDPCYIGRHNQVYEPPRELLQVLPGAEFVEMERNSERSFCCGAGGARMWMEETIGERINTNRSSEAVGTGADQIAVGCPFCRVMLSDGVTALKDQGEAREEVEVLDVAQMLLASVKGEPAIRAKKVAAGAATEVEPPTNGVGPTEVEPVETTQDEATKAEPEQGDATQTEGTITDTADAGPAAKASGSDGGSSLFDLGGDDEDAPSATEVEPVETPTDEASPTEVEPVETGNGSGGSLFDLGDADTSEPEPVATQVKPDEGGSLFDLGGDDSPAAEASTTEVEPAETTTPEPKTAAESTSTIPESGSLFDLGSDDSPAAETATTEVEPVETATTEVEPVETTSPDPEATSEIPEGGSLFDISGPADAPASNAEAEPSAQADDEPATTGDESPTADDATSADTTETTKETPPAPPAGSSGIPEGGSLFDIAVPAGSAAASSPEPAAKADPEAEPAAESAPAAKEAAPDPEPAATADSGKPDPAAVSAAATAAASDGDGPAPGDQTSDSESDDPATQPDDAGHADEAATDEAGGEEAEADAPEPKPAPSGESQQPKTDVDINEKGSLFDL